MYPLPIKLLSTSHQDNIGTVCNDNFKGSTARVICIYLGFSCSVWWESGAQQNESWTTVRSHTEHEDHGKGSFTYNVISRRRPFFLITTVDYGRGGSLLIT